MNRLPVLLIVPLLLMACAGRDIRPTAEEVDAAFPPGETQRCIDIRRVRRIEPIGNHTLLFHMPRGDVWRNRLRATCPGMHQHSKFLYEIRGSQLCSHDSFYLLIDDGFGFRRGAGCALGEFDLLTEEQAEALRQMR
ncbi:MAG: hypothetical protein EA417_09550 [Gammaproteobacteria bacterium]|nr:MAG: hypothetical protein EA417_09550 [Gammaproteobacteria bacterium]